MASGTIYGLADPATEEIRYVGQTVRNPRGRLREHVRNAERPLKAKGQRRLRAWLRSLQEEPLLVVLEETGDLDEAECRWIAKLREEGSRLCNMTDGGVAVRGLVGESKRKQEEGRLRATEKARDPEVRRRAGRAISATTKGREPSEAQLRAAREHSERMRGRGNPFYGRRHTDETKKAIGVSTATRRHSHETRARISASLRATNAERRSVTGQTT